MKILFNRVGKYDGVLFSVGNTYDLPEENGFAARWLKRGGQVVEDFEGTLSVNRLCIGYVEGKEEEAVKAPVVEEVVEVAKEEEEVVEAPVVEEVVEVAKEEEVVENKPKRVRKPRGSRK